MDTFQLYFKLTGTPLFTGMSREELQHIVSHTKFDFQKAEAGQTFIEAGTRCGQLWLILDGTVSSTMQAVDHSYEVSEELEAPFPVETEAIFGLKQVFIRSYTALTTVSYLTLDKSGVLKLLNSSLIFRLNFINYLSTAQQKRQTRLWNHAPTDLESRIVRFFMCHCSCQRGRKDFKIRMTTLARELGNSRLKISESLNSLQNQGFIRLSRCHIVIPDLEPLAEAKE